MGLQCFIKVLLIIRCVHLSFGLFFYHFSLSLSLALCRSGVWVQFEQSLSQREFHHSSFCVTLYRSCGEQRYIFVQLSPNDLIDSYHQEWNQPLLLLKIAFIILLSLIPPQIRSLYFQYMFSPDLIRCFDDHITCSSNGSLMMAI